MKPFSERSQTQIQDVCLRGDCLVGQNIPNPRQIYWQSQTNVKANGSAQQSDGDDDQRVCPGQTDKDCRDRVKDLPLQGSNDLLLVARNSVVSLNDVVDDTEILKIGRK